MRKRHQTLNKQNDAIGELSATAQVSRVQAQFFGMAGGSLVVLVQMASLPSLDTALTISTYSLSVALPFLMLVGIQMDSLLLYPDVLINSKFDSGMAAPLIGVMGFMIGIEALFWHFSVSLGVLAVLLWCVAWMMNSVYRRKLEETREQSIVDEAEK